MVNRGRGQLILTAAILVALTIVASAVLLNSIHASADVQSQQERQGLEQTERFGDQVQQDLSELFMRNGSEVVGGPAPFVFDKDKFGTLVDEYDEQYRMMSTQSGNGFTNMTFIEAETDDASAGWQNDTDACLTSDGTCNGQGTWNLISNGDVTYLNITITEILGDDLEIEFDQGANAEVIELTDNTVDPDIDYDIEFIDDNGNLVTSCAVENEGDISAEIEVNDGSGEIRTDTEICTFEVDTEDINFKIEDGGDTKGTLLVISDATFTGKWDGDGHGEKDDIIADPVFEIQYQSPEVTYSSTYRPFEGDS